MLGWSPPAPRAQGGAPTPTLRPFLLELAELPAALAFAESLNSERRLGIPAAEARLRATATARARIGAIEQTQETVLAELTRRLPTTRVVGRIQRVYNGIMVLADPESRAILERIPGVVAVHAVVPKRRTNSTSMPFLGTPAVWGSLGFTGAGMRVGILDSGIDYLHTAFGGSGLAVDYAANDTTALGEPFFPSFKVVAGWDFVGDSYDAASPDPMQQIPQPDPDPMDCNGHGTHVAGTVAGFGTLADGSTYPGPFDDTTPFGALGIGPGMAPEAELVALRVFGCSGDTAVVELALEWAVDPDGDGDFSDRLDVVNLSLTSPFATADDPTALAATAAVAAGVVVVASAGNEGDQHFAVGSPATGDGVLAVAATWDDDPIFPSRGVRVESPPSLAGAHQAGGAGFGPPLVGPVTGPAVRASPADACSPLINTAAEIDGHIAVIDRSVACTYVTQVRHAQQAGESGALGVVMVNNRDGLEGLPNDGTGGDITIPPLMVRRLAGQAIVAALDGRVELTLTPMLLGDMFASFSSRGPRRGDQALAPQVAAPGVAITSARVGNSTDGGMGASILSGTSMAAPHVAGAAALLRQARPDWEPAAVAAALAQTSGDVSFDPEGTPPVMSPARMGAGRLRPTAALATEVVVFDAENPGRLGLGFGPIEVEGDAVVTVDRTLRIENRGATTAGFTVALRLQEPMSGVTASLPDGSAVLVAAGGSSNVRLRLAIEGAALRHTHDPTLDASTFGFPRHWQSEVAGWVELEPVAGATETLRVPFLAAPRPVATTTAATAVALRQPSEVLLPLTGRGLPGGGDPTLDERSRLTVLELQQEISGPSDDFTVTHVGVGSDFFATGDLATSRLFLGLASSTPWSTPHGVVAEVLIDTDRDGFADFRLDHSDRGSEQFGFVTDAFVGVLHDLALGTSTVQPPLALLPPDQGTTRPLGSRTMVLVVSVAELGLAPGASLFDYAITLRARTATGAIARGGAFHAEGGPAMPAEVLTWDPTTPGLSFAGGWDGAPLWPDIDDMVIPGTFDPQAFADHQSLGILLLHHHHPVATQVETLDPAQLVPSALFADGFESGDTSAWR